MAYKTLTFYLRSYGLKGTKSVPWPLWFIRHYMRILAFMANRHQLYILAPTASKALHLTVGSYDTKGATICFGAHGL